MFLRVVFISAFVLAILAEEAPKESKSCRDNIPNCESYDESDICHSGLYPKWTKSNCEAFCGLCKRTEPCQDAIDDCSEYDLAESCDGQYKKWAVKNCERSCGYCKDPNSVPTKPTKTIVKPTKPGKRIEPDTTRTTDIDPTNSMIVGGVSSEDREFILSRINEIRSKVEPPAKNMPKVIWDENLAVLAYTMTQGPACQAGGTRDKVYASSKLYGQFVSWNDTILDWISGSEKFQIGKDALDYAHTYQEREILLKYTKVVDSDMVRMGCAVSECDSSQFYICRLVRGHTVKKFTTPYEAGKRCESCPRTCKHGLCDCGGLLCYGTDKLNVDTCKCETAN